MYIKIHEYVQEEHQEHPQNLSHMIDVEPLQLFHTPVTTTTIKLR